MEIELQINALDCSGFVLYLTQGRLYEYQVDAKINIALT